MIMPQVNVLPVSVSQDTDMKKNNSSSAYGERTRDKGFSNLVDQHIKKKEFVESNKRPH